MNDGILSVIILFYLNIGGFLFICEGKPFFLGGLLLEYYEYPVK